jgi:hypothetical protein
MKVNKAEYERCLEEMRKHCPPGTTVYTVLEHVSRSGMSREIRTVLLSPDGDRVVDLHPNYMVSQILGERQGKSDGVILGGTGMDMGFHLVYSLSRHLYRDGFSCIGSGCPSNDHSNGDRDYTPHHHNDGGYALKQRWL